MFLKVSEELWSESSCQDEIMQHKEKSTTRNVLNLDIFITEKGFRKDACAHTCKLKQKYPRRICFALKYYIVYFTLSLVETRTPAVFEEIWERGRSVE